LVTAFILPFVQKVEASRKSAAIAAQ